MGQWRGEPFAHLDTAWFDGQRDPLLAERDAARSARTDLRLERGEHAELLPELAERVVAAPFDERLAGQYMLALHRAGRTAESLAHYDRLGAALAAETGAEPGADLRVLRRRILGADPALAVSAGPSVPRQLPATPPSFVGRHDELARLTAALDTSGHHTFVIGAIGGAGGIGKTWLALHWAHRNLDRFPDGQLFVNLRGFDPINPPTPAAGAVRGFLEALGVAPESIPREPEAQVGQYRSLLADKRMLVVLDNAADVAQVEPLLPGGARCTVLITSRSQLMGLMAGHGARSVTLDTLSDAEARELLNHHLGHERTAAEPDAVADLVGYCGGQALALGVVAARAVVNPRLPLAALATELHDATTRLDALETGELGTGMRAVLTASDRALSPAAAEMFRLLGLTVGPDIGLAALANLAGLPTARARVVVRELVSAHLVAEHQPARYRMHDLVRLYAAERARADLPTDDGAMARLVDFYLHTADAADRRLAPHRPRIPLDGPAPGCVPLPVPDATTALAWFDTEHAGLLAACEAAHARNWDSRTWQLAWTVNSFHLRRGHRHDSAANSLVGLASAQRLDDPRMTTIAHRQLGQAYDRLGQHTLASEHLAQALVHAERAEDAVERAHTHRVLAIARERQGDVELALAHAENAMRLFEDTGETVRATRMLNSIGWLLAKLGRYTEARTYCERSLAFERTTDDATAVAITLDSLGFIAQRLGEHAVALDHYTEGLALMRETGMDYSQAATLERMAETHAEAGDRDRATAAWHEAMELHRTQGTTTNIEQIRKKLAALGVQEAQTPTHSR